MPVNVISTNDPVSGVTGVHARGRVHMKHHKSLRDEVAVQHDLSLSQRVLRESQRYLEDDNNDAI